MEDGEGRRFRPRGGALAGVDGAVQGLTDELGPGESFRVMLPFRLPGDGTPAGLVVHHGDFPGVAIIGADQSWLHRPALQRFSGVQGR